MRYDPEKYNDLSYEHINFITENKNYILPSLIKEYAIIEIVIVKGRLIVETQHAPIRYGRYCGSRVILGESTGIIDLNPKFIWNGREWLLNTFGTILFAEIELNIPDEG